MAAARFWRAVGFDTHGGGDLALSALTLSDAGGRIDQLASLTSAHAPAFGALAALGDGLGDTVCVFTAAVARSPGFALVWDFGAGVAKDVLKIGIGAGPSPGQSAERLQLHSSGDGSDWAAEYAVTGIPDQGLSDVSVDYNSLVLASGPVAFWPLDETSGTTAAELVAGRNGTRAGGTLITPGLAPLSPAAFDPATSGLITIPSSSAFDLATFTFEFWLKTATTNNLVVLERNANNGFSVQTTGVEGNPNFAVNSIGCAAGQQSGTPQTAGASIPVNTGAPTYCVVTVKPAGARVYINGVDVTKSSDVMMPSWGNAPIFIGSRAGTYGMPAGSAIDKVALYGRELDLAEIAEHYNGRDIRLGQLARRTKQLQMHRLAGNVAGAAGVTAPSHQGLIRDMEYSGRGFVASTVKLKNSPENTPLRRQVRLIHERSGLPVGGWVWSDPVTGNYRFDWIDESQAYTVISYDYEHKYRAVVANNLTLANGGVELMP